MAQVENAPGRASLGDLVQEFVNRVSHARGDTLAVLAGASVTLPQVLLLRRMATNGENTSSELAEQMHMSLPAVSQMVDRLFQLGLVSRAESLEDRRKKRLGVTPEGRALLKRIARARSADYAAGLTPLSPRLRAALSQVLRDALEEL